jgi:hypothetical protein
VLRRLLTTPASPLDKHFTLCHVRKPDNLCPPPNHPTSAKVSCSSNSRQHHTRQTTKQCEANPVVEGSAQAHMAVVGSTQCHPVVVGSTQCHPVVVGSTQCHPVVVGSNSYSQQTAGRCALQVLFPMSQANINMLQPADQKHHGVALNLELVSTREISCSKRSCHMTPCRQQVSGNVLGVFPPRHRHDMARLVKHHTLTSHNIPSQAHQLTRWVTDSVSTPPKLKRTAVSVLGAPSTCQPSQTSDESSALYTCAG